MKRLLIDTICWTLAIVTVLVTRLLLPALELAFAYFAKLIDESLASVKHTPALAVASVAVPLTSSDGADSSPQVGTIAVPKPAKPKATSKKSAPNATSSATPKRTRRKATTSAVKTAA